MADIVIRSCGLLFLNIVLFQFIPFLNYSDELHHLQDSASSVLNCNPSAADIKKWTRTLKRFLDQVVLEWTCIGATQSITATIICFLLPAASQNQDAKTTTIGISTTIIAVYSVVTALFFIIKAKGVQGDYTVEAWAKVIASASVQYPFLCSVVATPRVAVAWSIMLMTAAFLTYLWERPEISNITNTPTSTSDMMLPYAHRIWLTVLPSVLGMHSWFNAYQFKIITKKIQLLPCSTSPLTILTETNTIRLSSPAIPVLSSSPVAQTCDHSPAILNSQAYGDHSQEAPSLLSIDRITTSPEDAGRTNPSGTSILPNTDQSQTSEQRPDFAHHDDDMRECSHFSLLVHKRDLARHDHTHLSPIERRYRCDVKGCTFTAVRMANLQSHRATHERLFISHISGASDPPMGQILRHRRRSSRCRSAVSED